ncbi:hypothetical protein BV25DRAFT_685598 [Artomyces pyxidatus]|uniref:Uncharacterized protein n=1 Tax=Artomyces pyxidatus TaxID=48021 RepID=A0ACB8T0I0_9AGAM|nr:hypothetical protein BV25DRAFT_685598 [Artomyces pyxidatus]
MPPYSAIIILSQLLHSRYRSPSNCRLSLVNVVLVFIRVLNTALLCPLTVEFHRKLSGCAKAGDREVDLYIVATSYLEICSPTRDIGIIIVILRVEAAPPFPPIPLSFYIGLIQELRRMGFLADKSFSAVSSSSQVGPNFKLQRFKFQLPSHYACRLNTRATCFDQLKFDSPRTSTCIEHDLLSLHLVLQVLALSPRRPRNWRSGQSGRARKSFLEQTSTSPSFRLARFPSQCQLQSCVSLCSIAPLSARRV